MTCQLFAYSLLKKSAKSIGVQGLLLFRWCQITPMNAITWAEVLSSIPNTQQVFAKIRIIRFPEVNVDPTFYWNHLWGYYTPVTLRKTMSEAHKTDTRGLQCLIGWLRWTTSQTPNIPNCYMALSHFSASCTSIKGVHVCSHNMKHDESMKARLRYQTPSDLLIWRTASDCPLPSNSCSTLSVNVLVHKEGSDTAQPLHILLLNLVPSPCPSLLCAPSRTKLAPKLLWKKYYLGWMLHSIWRFLSLCSSNLSQNKTMTESGWA